MEDIATLGPYQTQTFLIKKDEAKMRKEAQGILKSFLAPPRPLCNPLQLAKIFGKEGDDLVGLAVVEGADYNGIRREEGHELTVTAIWIVTIVQVVNIVKIFPFNFASVTSQTFLTKLTD